MSEISAVLVLDDIRELPDKIDVPVFNCKTPQEFASTLGEFHGKAIQVILDHDLGESDGETITSRKSISFLTMLHRDEIVNVDRAFVVTSNPVGRDWIVSELENAGIPYFIDYLGGQSVGLIVPDEKGERNEK